MLPVHITGLNQLKQDKCEGMLHTEYEQIAKSFSSLDLIPAVQRNCFFLNNDVL